MSLAVPPSASLPPLTPTLQGDLVDSDAEEEAHLAHLLEGARQAARRAEIDPLQLQQETVLFDDDSDDERPIASTSAQKSASAYLEKPLRKRDLGADAASAPAASRKGKEVDRSHAALDNAATKWNSMPTARLSKKQAKAAKPHTAGSAWFDMPAPEVTPAMKREVQAMRLTGALDPKHFQRGEAKRDRGKMPEFFQLGHVIESRHPASTAASAPVARKRTFVETLVDDTEARAYATKKFREVQSQKASGGKSYYRAKQAARKAKA